MPHFLPSKTALLPGMIVGLVLAGGCAHRQGCKQKPSPTGKRAGYPDGYCAGYYPTCWRRWPDDCPTCPVDLGEVVPAESLPPGERPEATEEMPVVPYDPAPAPDQPDASDAAPPNGMEPPEGEGAAPEGDSSLPEAPLPDEVPSPDDDTSTNSKAKGPLVRNERAPQGAPPPSKDSFKLVAKRRTPARPAPMILITQPNDRVAPRQYVPKGKARYSKAKPGTAASSPQATIMNPFRAAKNREQDEAIARCTDKPRVEPIKSSKSKLKSLFARSKPAPDDEVKKAASVVVRDGP